MSAGDLPDNEFPDRIADTLPLVPLGYAAGLPWLGWLAALLAALTAYVRVFGGALGLAQDSLHTCWSRTTSITGQLEAS